MRKSAIEMKTPRGYSWNINMCVYILTQRPSLTTCACTILYSGPYHSANNSERGHKLTKLLYEFTTNKKPESLGEQLARATDTWLAGMLVADLEAQHPFGIRGESKERVEIAQSYLRMPRNVVRMELQVSPVTFVVEQALLPGHGDISHKLTWLYWSLLQFSGNLFPRLDASLPRCPACKELHDCSQCPHHEKNVELPLSAMPGLVLRVGTGIQLATGLQLDAGSFSNITCTPGCVKHLVQDASST